MDAGAARVRLQERKAGAVAGVLAQSEPVLRDAAATGHVRIVAARYDLASGAVEFLP